MELPEGVELDNISRAVEVRVPIWYFAIMRLALSESVEEVRT